MEVSRSCWYWLESVSSVIQRQDNHNDLTLGSGKPDAWHLRLTVEPLFTTKLPGDGGVDDGDDDDHGDHDDDGEGFDS